MPIIIEHDVKVADEVWIATALLHSEQPERTEFAVDEIVERARKERMTDTLRPGVYIHAQMHCVANRPPNPGRYRMLFQTQPGYRRLYCPSDPFDSRRDGGKIAPVGAEIPVRYRHLISWYAEWCKKKASKQSRFSSLLELEGSGKDLWRDESADQYIDRLREGWE